MPSPLSPKNHGVAHGSSSSAAELLTLLKHPQSTAGRGMASAVPSGSVGALDADFSRLYLGNGPSSPKGLSTSTIDNWGMSGLADLVSMAAHGRMYGPSPFGLDLRLAGLGSVNCISGSSPSSEEELLSRSFVSPWVDCHTATGSVEQSLTHPHAHLESVLPPCYNVQPSPPVEGKLAQLSDETLFYMFWGMPGDCMQQLAARELWGREWRYHRELKLWIQAVDEGQLRSQQKQMISPDLMKLGGGNGNGGGGGSSIVSASGPTANNQSSSPTGCATRPYTVFDPHSWTRITRDLHVRPEQLEAGPKTAKPASSVGTAAPAATPVLAPASASSVVHRAAL